MSIGAISGYQLSDVDNAPQPETVHHHFRKRFHRNKKELEGVQSFIPDMREPKVNALSHFYMLKIFGLNSLFVVIGCIGAMGYGVIPVVCQYLLGSLIDVFASPEATSEAAGRAVNRFSIQLTILACCGAIAFAIHHCFMQLANARLGTSMRKSYMGSMAKQEMNFFDIKKIGSLTVVLSEDIPKIQDVYTNELFAFLQEIIQFIVGFVLSLTVNYQMALILFSTTPLTFILHTVLSTIATVLTRKINKCTDKSAAAANEIASCMKTIRSMAGEEKEVKKFDKDLKRIDTLGLFMGFSYAIFLGFSVFVTWATIALGFWYGGHQIVEGKSTIGSIFKVFGMMFLGIVALIRSATFFPRYGKAYASETTFLKVVLRKPAIPFKGGKNLEKVEGEIVLQDVDFAYPSRPNINVMTNFNLHIRSGQTIALVGPSGSGKSTIVGLLERFYTPNKGSISIDGVDISELDPMWLHRHCLGIVSQEPVLFAGSIKYNIAYALLGPNEDINNFKSVTMEQIESVAKRANAHNFIMELPDKYDTPLGEKGVSLSGGQKQRIAIARALLQDPKILLLDEATSALDTESERLVQAALDELMKGRTTICIAHRLTTIVNADVICVLVRGALVEQGTHQDLIQIKDGVYRNLAQKQMMIAAEQENILKEDLPNP